MKRKTKTETRFIYHPDTNVLKKKRGDYVNRYTRWTVSDDLYYDKDVGHELKDGMLTGRWKEVNDQFGDHIYVEVVLNKMFVTEVPEKTIQTRRRCLFFKEEIMVESKNRHETWVGKAWIKDPAFVFFETVIRQEETFTCGGE